jgi:hypothetical protein
VVEDDLVEVEATDLDLLRPADHLEPVGSGPAHHGRVEGAAAEVVHGDGGADLDLLAVRVGQRRGLRGGQEQRVGQSLCGESGSQGPQPVSSPPGRVGHRDARGLPVHGVQQRRGEPRGDHLGGHRDVPEPQRHRVTDPAGEPPCDAVGFGQRAALGVHADQEASIRVGVHHRRSEDFEPGDPVRSARRDGGARGAKVETCLVRHRVTPSGAADVRTRTDVSLGSQRSRL